jgi:hypothetical protein
MKALQAIPAPFDKVISGKKISAEKKKVQKSIDSLQLQAKLISQVADKVGVHLNVQ